MPPDATSFLRGLESGSPSSPSVSGSAGAGQRSSVPSGGKTASSGTPPGPASPSGPRNPTASANGDAPARPSSGQGAGADDRKARAAARQKLADATRPLRSEIVQIDQRLERLGSERTQVEAMLATSGLAPPAIAEQGRRLNHIGAEMAMLEERWLELNEQLEQMQAGARG